jgi:hypothetical protein
MTCIQIGGALVHFADDDEGPRHHAVSQARCEDCGRFMRWDERARWWDCTLHGGAPR